MKKYELTDETMEPSTEETLHRIRAVRSFGIVDSGDPGGWIESESNLSQGDGDAWVDGNARVCGNALVCGNAMVSGSALVDNNAQVGDDARVNGYAMVDDHAQISGYALVGGTARISGHAQIRGHVWIGGNAKVFGNARIRCQRHIYWQDNIGSRGDTVTFYRDSDRGISVVCGCFRGTIAEFAEAVKKTHGENRHARDYAIAIENAKRWIDLSGDDDEKI